MHLWCNEANGALLWPGLLMVDITSKTTMWGRHAKKKKKKKKRELRRPAAHLARSSEQQACQRFFDLVAAVDLRRNEVKDALLGLRLARKSLERLDLIHAELRCQP